MTESMFTLEELLADVMADEKAHHRGKLEQWIWEVLWIETVEDTGEPFEKFLERVLRECPWFVQDKENPDCWRLVKSRRKRSKRVS